MPVKGGWGQASRVPCPSLPAHALVSMEAAVLMVSEACEAAGLPYYHGLGTISYTSCILL